jgi:hypothetical protein
VVTSEKSPLIVYVVRYGSYWPAEIDSIFADKELASARADVLNDATGDGADWHVEAWVVRREQYDDN